MNLRKTRVMAVCLILVLTLAISGTFAYLQSQSDPVVNKFNDNEVVVDLEESTGNNYNIMPGTSESKDPIVTVDATCPAYVYVKVNDNTAGLVTYTIENGWSPLEGYENVYWREVNGEQSPYEFHVLDGDMVYYSSALTGDQIKEGKEAAEAADPVNGISLTFQSYAIQKVPFNDPVLAWHAVNPVAVGTEDELARAVANGESVILSADIELSETLVVDKLVSIDLNGHTIYNTEDIWGSANWSLISVRGGNLLITGNGKMLAKENDCYALDVCDNGKLTIESGEFVGNITAVYDYEGSVDIRGGKYSVLQKDDGSNPDGFLINSYDANWRNGKNSIAISGGQFAGFNPADCPAEGQHTNFVTGGHTVEASGNLYTVK